MMLGGIPTNIHHGGARDVTSHGVPVKNLRLVFHGSSQLLLTSIVALRHKVVLCFRKWDLAVTFFIGMLGGNRQDVLGRNDFFPASRNYSMHWKITHSSASKLLFPYILFADVPQYLLTPEYHNPIHKPLTAGTNSSFRARGHAGCWLEYHPASFLA